MSASETAQVVTESTVTSRQWVCLVAVALGTVLIHLLTGNRYGFHRDELATLHDARHLAWGYVAYPPITPFFGRLSLLLFGNSLAGFRFFASVADAVVVVLAGLMARELGGGRGAQLLAAAAAVPFSLAAGTLMQYVSFDYLAWVLVAYLVVRLLRSGDPRWWLAIGTAIGMGMLAKYTVGFLVIGIVVGVLLTDARRFLKSKWLWLGVLLSILIFAPNMVWEAQHSFVSLDFLQAIHARDVRIGRTQAFLPGQLLLTLLAAVLAGAGLCWLQFTTAGKRFRMLGWMYIVPLALFIVAKARFYYLAPAYPMLYAAGAVWGERWVASVRPRWAAVARGIAWSAAIIDILALAAITLPIAPVKSSLWNLASKVQGDFREEIGWPELVQTIAQVRDSIPQQDRDHLGILAGNYGEAGAIELYGMRYGLPAPISGINSFWYRGYGAPPPDTLIVVGIGPRFLSEHFSSCQIVAHTWNRYGVENEETQDHPDIYLCRGLRQSWPEFWRSFRYYG